jgi:hypothetical protein
MQRCLFDALAFGNNGLADARNALTNSLHWVACVVIEHLIDSTICTDGCNNKNDNDTRA